MASYPHCEDDLVRIAEEDSYFSPLSSFRPRSRTMINLGECHALEPSSRSLRSQQVVIPSHLRLQVSIPGVLHTATPDSLSPQSESPETPLSLSSPIAGVVDLTKHIKTISTFAVAQGGLSDIYKGEWYQSERDCEGESKEAIVVPVCPFCFHQVPWPTLRKQVAIKLLRILTRKDQDGVRARKVQSSKLTPIIVAWTCLFSV